MGNDAERLLASCESGVLLRNGRGRVMGEEVGAVLNELTTEDGMPDSLDASRHEDRSPAATYLVDIPSAHQTQFQDLLELTAEELDALLSALQSTAPTAYPDKFVLAVAQRLGWSPEKGRSIVLLLLGMYLSVAQTSLTVQGFADQILDVSRARGLSTSDWSAVNNFLQQALSLESTVGVTSKAYSVLRMRGNLYIDAKIMTDVRPVFGREIDADLALVPVHTLILSYVDGSEPNSEPESFYCSLDKEDLQNLAKLIERALAKEDRLQTLLEGEKGVTWLPIVT